MPQGSVPEVGHVRLAAVEKLVQSEILVRLAAVLPGRTLGVVVGVRHQSVNSCVESRVSV